MSISIDTADRTGYTAIAAWLPCAFRAYDALSGDGRTFLVTLTANKGNYLAHRTPRSEPYSRPISDLAPACAPACYCPSRYRSPSAHGHMKLAAIYGAHSCLRVPLARAALTSARTYRDMPSSVCGTSSQPGRSRVHLRHARSRAESRGEQPVHPRILRPAPSAADATRTLALARRRPAMTSGAGFTAAGRPRPRDRAGHTGARALSKCVHCD
ncbi:hypothetical protein WOLCODRAFT_162363 [Wolfiporia cocos MD-104 SS10]|uniref:Uncharacterized protein n=1 Tax=Wolfiporia cocos (strain MD-104) TaxID=742152 RepID=A0A2H3JDZ1_WOLCO|nr:hypothetical protein WOLCODRAFT_162363 [Wolfiporia cocos MD-104 SS10]